MPGGNKNITGADGKLYSNEYQPKNRRKSTKFLTELLTKNLKVKKEITIDGIDTTTGLPTKIKIPMPTKDVIVQALLRQAAKGNMIAIKEVFDRTEGKSIQGLELTGKDGKPIETNNNHVHEVVFKKFNDTQIENDNNTDIQRDL